MKIIRHPLFMRPHPDDELEHWIDRELRGLPDRPAPETLMPRVLQAIAARQSLPWWRKSYVHWPPFARWFFLVASSGLAAFLAYGLWGMLNGATPEVLGAELRSIGAGWNVFRSLVETLGSAARILVKSAGAWWMWGAATVAGVSYLTTVSLGTVCWRLVTRRE